MAFMLLIDGQKHEVTIVRRRPHLVLRVNGRDHEVRGRSSSRAGRQTLVIDGDAVEFVRAAAGESQFLRLDGRSVEVKLADTRATGANAGAAQDSIKAPMPGAIISVHKAVGETVSRGETVVTIESMKLQTALGSPRDGVIATIRRALGDSFEKDEVIVSLEPLAEEA